MGLVRYLERKGVHVGAESNDGGSAGANLGDDAGAGEGEGVGDAEAVEVGTDEGAGVVLPEPELRVLVDQPPDGHQPALVLLRKPEQLRGVVAIVGLVRRREERLWSYKKEKQKN